ncbi:MAG: EamA family transporter [Alphaproteobacteria bacterium]
MVYIFLFFSITTLCLGQLLLKKSALILNTLPNPLYLAKNPFFICALACYGLSMLSWIHVLQFLPISRAYMFVSSAFVVLPILSHYFFNEPLSPRFFMGAAFIIAGVILTTK